MIHTVGLFRCTVMLLWVTLRGTLKKLLMSIRVRRVLSLILNLMLMIWLVLLRSLRVYIRIYQERIFQGNRKCRL